MKDVIKAFTDVFSDWIDTQVGKPLIYFVKPVGLFLCVLWAIVFTHMMKKKFKGIV